MTMVPKAIRVLEGAGISNVTVTVRSDGGRRHPRYFSTYEPLRAASARRRKLPSVTTVSPARSPSSTT
jgi:hypothetical protein